MLTLMPVLLMTFVTAGVPQSASPSPGAVPATAAGPSFEIPAKKAPAAPVVDGRIAEDEWQGAATVDRFTQFSPHPGDPSIERTEAMVMYDERWLYLAFRMWDSEAPIAQLTKRDDDLTKDDSVTVLLDTYADRRTAYVFVTNMLGTQQDQTVAADGRSIDKGWDAPWKSAGQRTAYGWSVEIAIPFSSIKHAVGERLTWGLNFSRSRARTFEKSVWAWPLDDEFRVSQAGKLAGLTLKPSSEYRRVIPYVLPHVQQGTPTKWDLGLDGRYALTSTMAAYGTLYPDFATVEADQEEVNLTRFEVSLAEKRQFFLEGGEQFNQKIRTFYTRRVADISVGGKVLGKQGPWNLAALSVRAQPVKEIESANYTVLRANRDIFRRSNVATTLANRRFNGRDEGSISFDANLGLKRTLTVGGQLVKSYGQYSRGTMGYFIEPIYKTPTLESSLRYQHLGDRLADNIKAVGLIKDDDRRWLNTSTKKKWSPRAGPVERVEGDAKGDVYWSQTRTLRGWEYSNRLDVALRNKLTLQVEQHQDYQLFEKGFRNHYTQLEFGYNTRQYQSMGAQVEFGRNFDADYRLWKASMRHKLSAETSAEYELQRLTLTPDPEEESTWIHVVRGSHFFKRDLYLQAFYQTNSRIERRNLQVVFVYRYQPPFGTLQLVYQRGTAAFGARSDQGHSLFVKATTVLSF